MAEIAELEQQLGRFTAAAASVDREADGLGWDIADAHASALDIEHSGGKERQTTTPP